MHRMWFLALQVGMRLAARPSYGSSGREVNVQVNHFSVQLRSSQAFVYELEVRQLMPNTSKQGSSDTGSTGATAAASADGTAAGGNCVL